MGNQHPQMKVQKLKPPAPISFHSVHDEKAQESKKEDDAVEIPTTALTRPQSEETGLNSRWRRELEQAIKVTEKSNIIQHIGKLFLYQRRLAKGSSCCVLLCKLRNSDRLYALKEMNKYSKYNPSLYLTERDILSTLKSHPNVVTYFDSFIDNKCLYIATQYCGGGTLLDRIIKMSVFSENIAAKYITTLLNVIDFIHKHNIAHRDLKPNNIVFDKPGDAGILKLIDFGDAIVINDNDEDRTFVGTLHYFPPEMIKNRRRNGWQIRKGDMYSIGVIAYVLLNGCFPFHSRSNDKDRIKQLIVQGNVKWPNHVKLSENCKDFILSLLNQNVKERLNVKEALSHKWLRGDASHDDLGDNLKEYLEKFHYSNMLQRLLIDAILSEMTVEQKTLIVSELQKYKNKRTAKGIPKPEQINYTRTDSRVSEQEFVEFLIANHVDENTAKIETGKLFKMVSLKTKTPSSDFAMELRKIIEEKPYEFAVMNNKDNEDKQNEDDIGDILDTALAPAKSVNPKKKLKKTSSLKLIDTSSSNKLKKRTSDEHRSQTLRVDYYKSIKILNLDSKLEIEISGTLSELDSFRTPMTSDELNEAIAFGRSESTSGSIHKITVPFKHPSITVEQFRKLLSKAPQKLDIQSVIDDLDPKHTGVINLINVTNYTRDVKILDSTPEDTDDSALY